MTRQTGGLAIETELIQAPYITWSSHKAGFSFGCDQGLLQVFGGIPRSKKRRGQRPAAVSSREKTPGLRPEPCGDGREPEAPGPYPAALGWMAQALLP